MRKHIHLIVFLLCAFSVCAHSFNYTKRERVLLHHLLQLLLVLIIQRDIIWREQHIVAETDVEFILAIAVHGYLHRALLATAIQRRLFQQEKLWARQRVPEPWLYHREAKREGHVSQRGVF